jgi:DNA-binding transcriptional LysR family regulator
VQVGVPGLLLQAMDRGEFELVVGGRCYDERPGRALWREPLAWAFAEVASLDPSMPVPLAVFPEPCPYREAALTAMAQAGVDSRIAMVCPSGEGLRAAALAGFAVTPIVRSRIVNGLRVMPADGRLPPLPDVEFTLFEASHRASTLVTRLADLIAPTLAVSATL